MKKPKKVEPKKPFSISLPSEVKEKAIKRVNQQGWKSLSVYIENLIKND